MQNAKIVDSQKYLSVIIQILRVVKVKFLKDFNLTVSDFLNISQYVAHTIVI